MRSHLKVYFDFDEKTKEYSDEEKGRLLLAMLRYAKDGIEEPLTGNEKYIFPVFKSMIDNEIETYNAKIFNGSCGGRPPKKPNETKDNQEKPNKTKDNLNKKTETENNLTKPNITETPKKEERRKKKEEEEQEKENAIAFSFARFWDAYPRHEAKQTARKAFYKLNPDEELLEKMLDAIERWKRTAQWQEDGGRYIPHPATWINQRRWEDDPPKAADKPSYKPVVAQDYEQRDYSGEEETMEQALERLRAGGML